MPGAMHTVGNNKYLIRERIHQWGKLEIIGASRPLKIHIPQNYQMPSFLYFP